MYLSFNIFKTVVCEVNLMTRHLSIKFPAFISSLFTVLLFLFLYVSPALAEKFHIVYILADDIDIALDYKENVESVLGEDISRKLKIVGQGDKFSVIYDGGDSSFSVTRTLVEHGDMLEKAGFDLPFASKEKDYHGLYNVSYGMGPNMEPLKKLYHKVYGVLGEDVGQNLFIEETAWGNYTLIYRRRGDNQSTYKVARRHAKMLRSKRIKTSITEENNNKVVFGESSLLNEEELDVVVSKDDIKQEAPEDAEGPAIDDGKIVAKAPILTDKDESATQIAKPIDPSTTKPPELPPVTPVQLPVKPFPPKDIKIGFKKIYIAKNKAQQKKLRSTVKNFKKSKSSKRFEQTIETHIAKLRRKGRISKDEATGWMVFDLARDQSVVDINADRKFQAASMIKPFVALAFFHQVKTGKLKYGPKSKRNMARMIQRSSNSATNWVMKQVGGPKSCQRILKKYYGSIFKGTEIIEYIPAGGRTYRNRAYPSDYVRFLRSLWDKKLPYSSEMRRLMALPGRDRLYHGTPIPRGTLVYNKTGSTAHLCGDMGILVPKTKSGRRYPYVIVGVIEKKSRPSNYGSWVANRSKVIREVSTIVYKEMKKEHKLL